MTFVNTTLYARATPPIGEESEEEEVIIDGDDISSQSVLDKMEQYEQRGW